MRSLKTTSHASLGYSIRFLMVLLMIGSLTLLASNLISGQLFSFKSISSQGSIKKINVGVYWDGNCSNPVSSIDWGYIEPESINDVSVFIRNEGTAPSDLFLSTDNWSPLNAFEFMILSWDYNGQTLDLSEVAPVTLALQVSTNVTGIRSFSFYIIIGVTA